MFPAGETVTLHRRTVVGRDAFGHDVYATVDATVYGCAVWPLGSQKTRAGTGSTEAVEGRDQVTTDWELVLPTGTAVSSVDKVTVRGALCEVIGAPMSWTSPLTGDSAGVHIQARRVTG